MNNKKKKINKRPLSAIIQKNINNNNNNIKYKLNKKDEKKNSSNKLLNLKKNSLLNLLKKNIRLISYRNKVLNNNNNNSNLLNSSLNEKNKSENLKEYKFIPYIQKYRNINKDLIKNLTLFNQLGNTYDSYITKKENNFFNKSKNRSASKELSDRLIHSSKKFIKNKIFNLNPESIKNKMNFTSRNLNNLKSFNLSKINSHTSEFNNKNKSHKIKKIKYKIKRINSSKENLIKNLNKKIPNLDIKNILDKNEDDNNNNFKNHLFKRSSLIDRLIIKMSHPDETIEDFLNNNIKTNQYLKFEKQLKQKKNNIDKMIMDVKLHQRKTDRELEHYNPQLLIRKYILKTKYNQNNIFF